MPNWETNIWGHTISWNVLVPGLVLPGAMMGVMAVYPFIEAYVTGDRREHHLLERPRDNPTRTGLGVMSLVFYGLLWMNGGNDLIAYAFHVEINAVTRFTQVALILGPPISFMITKRACLGLQQKDLQRVLHGRETGIIKRLPNGEFIEVHEPISAEHRFKLMSREGAPPLGTGPQTDSEGIPAPRVPASKFRARLTRFWYADALPKPTAEEYHELTSGHGDHGGGHH
jgi:ubiquinol-cytochrome c reductase cytochrome b subunit